MNTVLLPNEIVKLIEQVNGKTGLKPSPDKESAVMRLRKALTFQLSERFSEAKLIKVLDVENFSEAQKTLNRVLGNDYIPKPMTGVSKMEAASPKASGEVKAPTKESKAPKVAKEPKAPKEPKVAGEKKPGGHRGRESSFSGKFIFPSAKLEGKNPRREGVPGWKAMNIVLENPGITTKEYLERGGRMEDLRWDTKKGNVELRDEK